MGVFSKKKEVAHDNGESQAPRKGRKLGAIGTIFASGSAMFADGYSNAAMSPVLTILSREDMYGPWLVGGERNKSLLAAMVFAGMVTGQLSFGWVSDKIGRKFAMFLCTAIIFVFSILAACSAGPTPQVLINCLIAFRFFLGIGLGGEYPSGSVAAAEATEHNEVGKKKQQRLFIWATNSQLDLAFTVAWLVALALYKIFGDNHLRAVWRGTLLLGAIPPLLLLIARMFMEEPDAYKKNSMRHTRIPYWLIIKRYWLKLAAVSIVWFIYNWVTYPFGIYSGTIVEKAVGKNPSLYQTLAWGALVNSFYVPGTIVGSFISDFIGPKYTMIFGLLMQAVFGFAMSGAYNRLVPENGQGGSIAGFAVMYGIFLAFGEVGPGNNLGLLASKSVGPTAARGQLYGIAAAIGKVGAFIGTYTFPYIQKRFDTKGYFVQNTGLFWVGSALAVFSATITFFGVHNIKPDHMIEEDAAFREYLAANGFDVSQMGEPGHREGDVADDVVSSGAVPRDADVYEHDEKK
ncbi:glycerophosphoinositol permease [Vanrija albida]|uniref:Glycerophosphoinositol permease n=1 Tax=Vanrija albida TaxID=181172 RepID=A0ABR3PZU3_9TREE